MSDETIVLEVEAFQLFARARDLPRDDDQLRFYDIALLALVSRQLVRLAGQGSIEHECALCVPIDAERWIAENAVLRLSPRLNAQELVRRLENLASQGYLVRTRVPCDDGYQYYYGCSLWWRSCVQATMPLEPGSRLTIDQRELEPGGALTDVARQETLRQARELECLKN